MNKDENFYLLKNTLKNDIKNKIIKNIIIIYLFSFTTLLISYYFFKNLLSKITFREVSLFKNQSQILKIGYILFIGYLCMDIYSYYKSISVISEIKILFLYTSLLIFFYSENIYNNYLKYILLIFLFLYLAIKTFVMPIISCTIVIVSIEWLIKRRINFVVLIIFLATFYFTNLTKSIHRNNLQIYSNTTSNVTLFENTKIFIKYSVHKKSFVSSDANLNSQIDITPSSKIDSLISKPVIYTSEQQFESLYRRISMSTQTLVHSIFYDEIIKNYNGKTIKFAFYSFIPSAVWHSKPSFEYANKFGRDLNFLIKSDYKTSINIPLITELYINYYFKGLFFGMCLFGLLISITEFLISIFLRKDKIFSFILIASTFSFTYIDTSAIYIVNGFIVKLIFLFVIVWTLNIILNILKGDKFK